MTGSVFSIGLPSGYGSGRRFDLFGDILRAGRALALNNARR
jgi:hypothetical protein